MYQVTVRNEGQDFYLRGTTWAFVQERGNVFATVEEAKAAIEKASKFMPAKIRRNVLIVPTFQGA